VRRLTDELRADVIDQATAAVLLSLMAGKAAIHESATPVLDMVGRFQGPACPSDSIGRSGSECTQDTFRCQVFLKYSLAEQVDRALRLEMLNEKENQLET
jgi:hypothetical protein